MKKRYKVLSDNFRQYKALASNAFELDKKINVITKNNIKELIKSFEDKKRKGENVFFYSSHKRNNEEERKPIGKITRVMKSEKGTGLDAVIEWNGGAEAILESKGFYPSIEFLGNIEKEENGKVFWKNLQIKAVAAVEDPASKGVELLCASALIINNLEGEKNMTEKLKELLQTLETAESEEEKQQAADELKELLKKDSALIDMYFDMLVVSETEETSSQMLSEDETEEEEEEDDDDDDEDETEDSAGEEEDEEETDEEEESGKKGGAKEKKKKKNFSECQKGNKARKKLSAEKWEAALEIYAAKKGYKRVSANSAENTFKKAKKLYERKDESLEACLSACEKNIIFLERKKISRQNISFSKSSKDEKYSDIAKAIVGE